MTAITTIDLLSSPCPKCPVCKNDWVIFRPTKQRNTYIDYHCDETGNCNFSLRLSINIYDERTLWLMKEFGEFGWRIVWKHNFRRDNQWKCSLSYPRLHTEQYYDMSPMLPYDITAEQIKTLILPYL